MRAGLVDVDSGEKDPVVAAHEMVSFGMGSPAASGELQDEPPEMDRYRSTSPAPSASTSSAFLA
jgi:hypothetical protein